MLLHVTMSIRQMWSHAQLSSSRALSLMSRDVADVIASIGGESYIVHAK